jgi:hypothetical protein
MRDFLKRCVGRSGGWLWPLALLALPGCAEIIGLEPWEPKNPLTTVVFCDLPTPPGAHCASPDEINNGIRQASGAVALNTGEGWNTLTIDDSAAAFAACAGITNGPQAVEFVTQFPKGIALCTAPATLTDANAFCVASCLGETPDAAFCASAHASTNVPVTGFPNACTSDGALLPGFVDPRPTPENVVWDPDPASLIGVTTPNGNDLQRAAATSQPPDFDAGAASTQWIERGDAYVEFAAAETMLSHVAGLSEISVNCPSPCTDTDPSLTDITFGISLNTDGKVYLLENGALVMAPDADGKGPDVNGSFGTYLAGERFRVSLRQSSDGSNTAIVTYSRLDVNTACIPGNPCVEDVFYTHVGLGNYPLRVDTSFREANATLTKVVVVRIQNK